MSSKKKEEMLNYAEVCYRQNQLNKIGVQRTSSRSYADQTQLKIIQDEKTFYNL